MEQEVMELDNEVRSWQWLMIRIGLKLGTIAGLLLTGAHYAAPAWVSMEQACYTRIEGYRLAVLDKLRLQDAMASQAESPRFEAIKDKIIRIAKDESISPVIVLAMAHRESGAGLRVDRMRFEPAVYERFKGRHGEVDSAEDKLWSTSLGLMQVIPAFHAKRCGLDSPTDLFKPEVGVRCGITALKACLADSRGDFPQALACYNGSQKYSNAIMSSLAEFAIKEFNLL